MKPYFGATNDKDQWWDGVTWKNFGSFDPKTGKRSLSIEDILTQIETLREHDLFNCHVDGVFKCPRCRRPHFIPDQFDYLCDGCVEILNTHPNTNAFVKAGLAEWAAKRAQRYTHPDIIARLKERDKLLAIARLEVIPPLSTPTGRDYQGALPPATPENSGTTMNVGFYTSYLTYRSHWNEREPSKSGWSWVSSGGIDA